MCANSTSIENNQNAVRFKGIIYSKMNILGFIHPHVVPKLNDFVFWGAQKERVSQCLAGLFPEKFTINKDAKATLKCFIRLVHNIPSLLKLYDRIV